MTVATFFDKKVYIQRMRGSGYKQSFNTTATADASIQYADAEAGQRLGIVEARLWLGFFDENADIQEGDKIRESVSGIYYMVREVTTIDYGINRHLQVLLEELNA